MRWNWQHSNQVVSEPVGRPVVHFVKFIIEKGKFYCRFLGQLTDGQLKVVERMFSEGINGFKGGLSAKNYGVITGDPSATTTRDLSRMVELGCLYENRRAEKPPVLLESLSIEFLLVVRRNSSILR